MEVKEQDSEDTTQPSMPCAEAAMVLEMTSSLEDTEDLLEDSPLDVAPAEMLPLTPLDASLSVWRGGVLLMTSPSLSLPLSLFSDQE